jgi:hypothetical protein
MRSQFKSTFQPALGGHHQVRLAVPVGRPQLFSKFQAHDLSGRSSARRVVLGATVLADERNAILSKIKNGTARMAQVRKWIASRIDADPMLLRTFGQQYISDNFWGYDDIVVKDQYYVDKAQGDLSEGRGTYVDEDVQGWEIDDETLGRVDEWALAIDNMYQGMQEFGKTALTTTGGQTIPNSTAPTTTVPPSSGGKHPVTGPTASPPSQGIPTKDLLTYGGIGLGTIVLALLLKNA